MERYDQLNCLRHWKMTSSVVQLADKRQRQTTLYYFRLQIGEFRNKIAPNIAFLRYIGYI